MVTGYLWTLILSTDFSTNAHVTIANREDLCFTSFHIISHDYTKNVAPMLLRTPLEVSVKHRLPDKSERLSKRTLNDRIIKALKPAPNGKRYMLMDVVVPNFGVEVTRTAHKSYKLVTRYPGRIRPERGHLAVYGEITLPAARDKSAHR